MKNKFEVNILFGEDFILKLNQKEIFEKEDFDMNCLQKFSFESKEELNAFLKGIDVAVGWNEYKILNEKEISYLKIK